MSWASPARAPLSCPSGARSGGVRYLQLCGRHRHPHRELRPLPDRPEHQASGRHREPLRQGAGPERQYARRVRNGVNGAYWCSQIAAGKLNGLTIRIYGSEGALEWEQHYPDYLKYTPKGKPTEILSRGTGYITEKAGAYSRIPSGHPEGLIVAFANIYKNIISAILAVKAGGTANDGSFDYPTVTDGLNGVKFIHAVIDSAAKDSAWVEL